MKETTSYVERTPRGRLEVVSMDIPGEGAGNAEITPNERPVDDKFRILIGDLTRTPVLDLLAERIEGGPPCPPLTVSFERCYVPEVALQAGVAKLAYAADSKWKLCDCCPLRGPSQQFETTKENHLDALPPLAGLLGNL